MEYKLRSKHYCIKKVLLARKYSGHHFVAVRIHNKQKLMAAGKCNPKLFTFHWLNWFKKGWPSLLVFCLHIQLVSLYWLRKMKARVSPRDSWLPVPSALINLSLTYHALSVSPAAVCIPGRCTRDCLIRWICAARHARAYKTRLTTLGNRILWHTSPMLLINALRTRNQKQISKPTLCFAELENRVSPTPHFMLI